MNILRTRIFLLPLLILFISPPLYAADTGVVTINAKNSAAEILESLKMQLEQKRFKIFSVYDHGDKGSVKQVIVFGKTNHNARIMWHDPAAGLELPLKIAVFQDDVGTQVIYRKPSSLRNTYSLQECNLLDELDLLMAELAQKAAQ
ncbi:MAG: hypothetical protein B6D72_08235 [gamma proteobacterium symbiont of Ctena orbiculata]|uniref:DUF302 domain-containing protein n=1 Tax=Candidatus Thiodiazotropha taylori TaxID=2792791 RepID=A0A944MDV7_9GAMM|nr:DUF302 domain-containing protein [Candidatus Thiodiazotropha taylori]PVV12300.1 MAG: hypothetical protein B6D72_08235 [gamma proteobacterium symbiont of Ctena orbiculata]MBT2989205.1 DUF302 domain-containing protein [Candidatus Thiodiazotropha taylori]MBT2995584.1 DUF302 domain-containing protein [Candidatus Thiodiazotropha taylori]MBT2999462.1 DUF302 domain-containing protein [Candidatus Thiodiazotropha taylori]